MPRPLSRILPALFASLVATSLSRAVAADDLLAKLDPFLSTHCYECHDDLTPEADLDLLSLDFDLKKPATFAHWDHVFRRVRSGEMPPKEKQQPTMEERNEFLALLRDPLFATDRADLEKFGRVHGRRLTRTEYEHTVHDLLGVDIPLANQLPADESGHEFDTKAEIQQLSHFHLDKYLAAADTALDEAFGRLHQGDAEFKRFYGPKELTASSGGNYRGPEARDGKVRMWRMTLQFAGRMPKTSVPESGWYRVTIKNARAINPGPDSVVWGSLRSGACYSDEPILYYIGSVEAGKNPRDHRFEAWIRGGHMLEFKANEATDKAAPSGASGGNISFKGRNLEKDGFAGIEFDGIEIERVYPHGPRRELLSKLLPGVKFQGGKPVIEDRHVELKRLLTNFAHRAFRRPAPGDQVAPYLTLATETLEKTGSLNRALRVGYRAILCSPRFLTFVEAPGQLDDFALANRLSYFLWSSLPDAELRNLAEERKLNDPKTLAAQVDRMLADPKSDRFVANFTDQWLNLKEIDFTTPDPRRFREFDPIVQDRMLRETRAFFAETIEENLGVENFVASDFAMLDTRLKKHYRLDRVDLEPGKGLQRISLPKDTVRSGLITQGSVLKVTADGSVTSPILRGIWVNERILGKHTPPPPPNVPAVEPDIRGATSIRDQLAKHSSDKTCASCHAKIDPAGFALENFDPVGQWRTAYGTSKNAAKVDPSGVTPEGATFRGIRDWKRIYQEQPEPLADAFARQLLTYGTGGNIRLSDEPHLETIVASAAKEGYGIRSLIHAAVASPIFQRK